MQSRPLREWEQGAHLHVLDFTHDTARYRFQAAGAVQVKAAAKAIAADPASFEHPPELPSLEAALTDELRKLYALGHATVRSELDHQRNGDPLPIGLSEAPEPPNLRRAKARKGRPRDCASCKMFDHGHCWGYGNWPVKPNQVCDSFERDPQVKTLALEDARRDLGSLRARARLSAHAVAHAIWHAVQLGRLHGLEAQGGPKRLRQAGRDAGNAALGAQASLHAGAAINGGREAAATQGRAAIVGARYTSVLDKNTCGPCAEADTGQLLALDDPALVRPPNPACLGGSRCRCILVYQLSTETPPAQPAARRTGTDAGRDVRPVAAVGVGAS